MNGTSLDLLLATLLACPGDIQYINMNDPGAFKQRHLDALTRFLERGTVWCLNIGETGMGHEGPSPARTHMHAHMQHTCTHAWARARRSAREC